LYQLPMDGHSLDDAIRANTEKADRDHALARERAATHERRQRAVEEADKALAELTADFVKRMAGVGNPCLKDRRRGSSHPCVMGWDLRAGRHRYGEEAYRVVSVDGTWLWYDPHWDRDRDPSASGAGLGEDKPSLDEATRLLAEALVGYGAVDPTGSEGRTLPACTRPAEVAAILSKYGHQIYGEAAANAWVRIMDSPDAPAPTHDILQVHGRGHIFGRWRFRVATRTRAWAVGDTDNDIREWIDEQGLVRWDADSNDFGRVSMPYGRRYAPVYIAVPRGEMLSPDLAISPTG
jgi:hypothetical protein